MDGKHSAVSEGFIEVTQKTWLPQIRMSREESLNENGSGGAKKSMTVVPSLFSKAQIYAKCSGR